jgi:uncharacterized protein YdaU (DUF1376 family)
MSGDPWFRFFPSDWMSGVSGLSAAERGVYVSLLALMYDRNGPLVRDDGRLSRQCGLPKAGFVRALDGLIATGKIIFEEGCLFNLRAKSELTERENRKLTATSSAHSRWQKSKQNQTSSDANAVLEQCGTDATRARVPQPQPQSDKKEREDKKRAERARLLSDLNAAFDRFWTRWPHKVGKPVALKAFARVAAEIEAIVAGVDRYIRDKPPDRSWMNPATFLNGRRWEDAPAAIAAHGGPRPFQQNPEKSVHAAARKLCDDVATGAVTFGPIPPSVGTLFARDRERKREDSPRLLSEG